MSRQSSYRSDIKGRSFISHVFKDETYLSMNEMI